MPLVKARVTLSNFTHNIVVANKIVKGAKMIVGVFFGGKSCEHNISVVTGMQVVKAVSVSNRAVPIFVDNEGVWWTGKELGELSTYKNLEKTKKQKVYLMPGSRTLYTEGGKKHFTLDCAFLCMHGFGGEDGAIQGLLTLCGVPFTGSGITASALCMDKTYTKKVLRECGISSVDYAVATKKEFEKSEDDTIKNIKKTLRYPLIVKPTKTGSSIGVMLANDDNGLLEALKGAFKWDNTAIVELALTDFTEFNCAVVDGDDDLIASEIEKPIGWKNFLSYSDKYFVKGGGSGRIFPADIDSELTNAIKTLAKKSYKALSCSGVARVDFLLKDENLYVNEINTIPGAMANYLFSVGENKMDFAELCVRAIKVARQNKSEQDSISYVYKSQYNLSGKKTKLN